MRRKKKKSGFGAEGSSLALPPNTEVFIAVAPSADELSVSEHASRPHDTRDGDR